MVFGGVTRERLQLNEDTLFAGGPYDPSNPEALEALPEARRLIFAGEYKKASELIGAKMMARPLKQMPYEPVGDLELEFPDHGATSRYRRELDLDTAVAQTTYVVRGVTFERQVFSSPVDQVIVVRLTAHKPEQITFAATLNTPQNATVTAEAPDTLVLRGRNGESSGIAGALTFQARVKVVVEGGTVSAHDQRVSVSNADAATILIAVATSYRRFGDVGGDPAESSIFRASRRPSETVSAIAREPRARTSAPLSSGPTRPWDERRRPFPHRSALRAFPEGRRSASGDPVFPVRSLSVVSSSRPGSQPANLQGLWNESMTPPWD